MNNKEEEKAKNENEEKKRMKINTEGCRKERNANKNLKANLFIIYTKQK